MLQLARPGYVRRQGVHLVQGSAHILPVLFLPVHGFMHGTAEIRKRTVQFLIHSLHKLVDYRIDAFHLCAACDTGEFFDCIVHAVHLRRQDLIDLISHHNGEAASDFRDAVSQGLLEGHHLPLVFIFRIRNHVVLIGVQEAVHRFRGFIHLILIYEAEHQGEHHTVDRGMESDFYTLDQRGNASRDLVCVPGIKLLEAQRQADKSAQNTETGHRAADQVEHISANGIVNQILIDIILYIAAVDITGKHLQPAQFRAVFGIALPQHLTGKQVVPALIVPPQVLLFHAEIIADRVRNIIELADHPVDHRKACECVSQKPRCNNKQGRTHDDIGQVQRFCGNIEINADRCHDDVNHDQSILGPEDAFHSIRFASHYITTWIQSYASAVKDL